MKRSIAILLVFFIIWQPLAYSKVSGKEVMYVGGTIGGLPEATIGALDTSNEKVLVFKSAKGNFEIPYENITSLEYGQKAGRRIGVSIALGAWMTLFSKKRKHFLTIGFNDENEKPQGVVLEIPKGTAKSTIIVIEVRSAKKVEYESEEAKKHVHG